jgi:hypothetical protein
MVNIQCTERMFYAVHLKGILQETALLKLTYGFLGFEAV